MWEYKRIDIKYVTINDLTLQLNNLGKDGWEIIVYDDQIKNNVSLLLKRPRHE